MELNHQYHTIGELLDALSPYRSARALVRICDMRAHPINQGDYAYSFVSLKRKNFISVTPLKAALNALILALNETLQKH